MTDIRQKYSACSCYVLRVIFLCSFALVGACSAAATPKGMIPASFEPMKAHPQTVRLSVTGGQESVAVGRPHITNAAFTEALVASIKKFQTFSTVVEDQSPVEEYLLTVTLFSLDKLVFGQTVKLEAAWTLRRAGSGAIVWRESIVSESRDSDVRLATEGAGRSNIAQALSKISKLDL